jgi:hypothetical protein
MSRASLLLGLLGLHSSLASHTGTGTYAQTCRYCPTEQIQTAFGLQAISDICYFVPLVEDDYHHCACELSGPPLTDNNCNFAHRSECGFYYTNTTPPKDRDPWAVSSEYVPWYPSTYINLHNVDSSTFIFDSSTMSRLSHVCGHCFAGWIEGKLVSGSGASGVYIADAATAGWNAAVFVPGADPQPNLLTLRRRVGGVFGCITDPCFNATGGDKVSSCCFAHAHWGLL